MKSTFLYLVACQLEHLVAKVQAARKEEGEDSKLLTTFSWNRLMIILLTVHWPELVIKAQLNCKEYWWNGVGSLDPSPPPPYHVLTLSFVCGKILAKE